MVMILMIIMTKGRRIPLSNGLLSNFILDNWWPDKIRSNICFPGYPYPWSSDPFPQVHIGPIMFMGLWL